MSNLEKPESVMSLMETYKRAAQMYKDGKIGDPMPKGDREREEDPDHEHPMVTYALPQGAPATLESISDHLETQREHLYERVLACHRAMVRVELAEHVASKTGKDLADAKALSESSGKSAEYESWVAAAEVVHGKCLESLESAKAQLNEMFKRAQSSALEMGSLMAVYSVSETIGSKKVNAFARAWVDTLLGEGTWKA